MTIAALMASRLQASFQYIAGLVGMTSYWIGSNSNERLCYGSKLSAHSWSSEWPNRVPRSFAAT
jgi:hypothetical protein